MPSSTRKKTVDPFCVLEYARIEFATDCVDIVSSVSNFLISYSSYFLKRSSKLRMMGYFLPA